MSIRTALLATALTMTTTTAALAGTTDEQAAVRTECQPVDAGLESTPS